MGSHDLLRLTVTNQIAFDQRDSSSILKFARLMAEVQKLMIIRHQSNENEARK